MRFYKFFLRDNQCTVPLEMLLWIVANNRLLSIVLLSRVKALINSTYYLNHPISRMCLPFQLMFSNFLLTVPLTISLWIHLASSFTAWCCINSFIDVLYVQEPLDPLRTSSGSTLSTSGFTIWKFLGYFVWVVLLINLSTNFIPLTCREFWSPRLPFL